MKYLLLLLLLTGCATTAQVPSVRCKQPAVPANPTPPAADEWVSDLWGAAVLSESAVVWIQGVLGVSAKQRALRQVEHDCLDELEDKGLIRQ